MITPTRKIEITSGSLEGKKFKFKDQKMDLVDGLYHEAILVVGTQYHNDTQGNKMMFFAQAVRTIKHGFINGGEGAFQSTAIDKATLIYFKQGYNDEEIQAVKDALAGENTTFKPIEKVEEMINYFNEPITPEKRIEKDKNGKEITKTYKRKIQLVHFYAHGLPSKITFGYMMNSGSIERDDSIFHTDNIDGPQTLSRDNINKIKPDHFATDAAIYSFACRTANTSYIEDFRPKNGKQKGNVNFSEAIPVEVHPEVSLAQKLADQLNVTVYAYMTRTEYGKTWTDKSKIPDTHLKDETVEAWQTIASQEKTNLKNELATISPADVIVPVIGGLKLIKIGAKTSIDVTQKMVSGSEEFALWHPDGAFQPVSGAGTPKGLDNKMNAFLSKKQREKANIGRSGSW